MFFSTFFSNFLGLLLKASKRYSQVVTKAFHVSSAALDVLADGTDGVVQLWVNADDSNHLVCNLDKKTPQVPLDIVFSEGEAISFFSKGNGTIYLTGNLLPEDPDYGLDGLDEEEQR